MPEHIVVRDPHIQGTPRSVINIENSRSFNSFFSKIQGSIRSSRSQSEAFPLYMRFPLENLWFCSLRPNPDIHKTSKRC